MHYNPGQNGPSARSERSVSQVRTVCQLGQNGPSARSEGLSARSEGSVREVRRVRQPGQKGPSARSERSVSHISQHSVLDTAICFPAIYKRLHVHVLLLLISTFVCAASHMYGRKPGLSPS